jgi:hypothetical protein
VPNTYQEKRKLTSVAAIAARLKALEAGEMLDSRGAGDQRRLEMVEQPSTAPAGPDR